VSTNFRGPACVLAPALCRRAVGYNTADRLDTARRLLRLFGTITNPPITSYGVGRGCGVGRGLGVTLGVAVGVGVAVAVGVGVAVAVGVGVAVAVGVGVTEGVTVGVGVGPEGVILKGPLVEELFWKRPSLATTRTRTSAIPDDGGSCQS
jgi:hypothetical protein